MCVIRKIKVTRLFFTTFNMELKVKVIPIEKEYLMPCGSCDVNQGENVK